MQVGMLGLGRMGANMTRRLLRAGHACVVFNQDPAPIAALANEGATPADDMADFVRKLKPPRAIWLMVPAGAVDNVITQLKPHLGRDDVVIDGGNSYYVDDLRRAAELAGAGVHYLDVGTSGGVWGLERGYCLMIGGEPAVVRRLDPLFAALAPGGGSPADGPTESRGYLHCGPAGAGHFVKMVHNGIEYGLMAAYAEGFGVLAAAGAGRAQHAIDAETTPLRAPAHYQYEFDLARIAEVWRHGSVVSSWLLDLAARALESDPLLDGFAGRVADSGEGRWTVQAAIDTAVPAPVLAAALYARFSSRGHADFQNRLLAALRYQFGGHAEPAAK